MVFLAAAVPGVLGPDPGAEGGLEEEDDWAAGGAGGCACAACGCGLGWPGGGESACSLAGVCGWAYRSSTWWQTSSRMSTSKSSTYWSHQWRCQSRRLFQSLTSNFDSLAARYMRAMAMISGSHCRQSVVHRLSLTKVQDICTIFCSFSLSPLRHLAYFMREE